MIAALIMLVIPVKSGEFTRLPFNLAMPARRLTVVGREGYRDKNSLKHNPEWRHNRVRSFHSK
jgi:hypothetical protein